MEVGAEPSPRRAARRVPCTTGVLMPFPGPETSRITVLLGVALVIAGGEQLGVERGLLVRARLQLPARLGRVGEDEHAASGRRKLEASVGQIRVRPVHARALHVGCEPAALVFRFGCKFFIKILRY
jgi:hypothetical protein